MQKAGDDVKEKIQSELDQVTEGVTTMKAEMADSAEAYRDSLNDQINSIRQRAKSASADARTEMDAMAGKLESKRRQVENDMVAAYKSYAKAIQNDIDRLNSRLDKVDRTTRTELVRAIEKRQSQLEEIKEKLR